MANKDNNIQFRITAPPKDISKYVLGRIKNSLRSIPNELIVIIREHEELTRIKK